MVWLCLFVWISLIWSELNELSIKALVNLTGLLNIDFEESASLFGKSTHISMISNSVTHLQSYTNSAIAGNSVPISPCLAQMSPRRAPMSPYRALISSHRMASVRVFCDVSQCFKSVSWCFTSGSRCFMTFHDVKMCYKCFMMFYDV